MISPVRSLSEYSHVILYLPKQLDCRWACVAHNKEVLKRCPGPCFDAVRGRVSMLSGAVLFRCGVGTVPSPEHENNQSFSPSFSTQPCAPRHSVQVKHSDIMLQGRIPLENVGTFSRDSMHAPPKLFEHRVTFSGGVQNV